MTALAEFVHSLNLAESVALLAKPMAALAKPVAAPAKSVAAHLEPNKVPIFVNHFCFLVTYLWLNCREVTCHRLDIVLCLDVQPLHSQ
jgi:hypothetical protein